MNTNEIHPLAAPQLTAFCRHDHEAVGLILDDAGPMACLLLCDALALSLRAAGAFAHDLGRDLTADDLAAYFQGLCLAGPIPLR